MSEPQVRRPMSSLDLSACDREPIQSPGQIQPHGILLVVEEPDLIVRQASLNTLAFVGREATALLGTSVDEIFERVSVAVIRERLAREDVDGEPVYLGTVQIPTATSLFGAIAHRYDGVLFLELEQMSPPDPLEQLDTFSQLKTAVGRIDSAGGLRDFYQCTAQVVQSLTGFDRVMVYQFLEDNHGVVIAEAKREDLDPYLGLHYPATDIPSQARALYRLNRLRLIPDAGYRAVDIVPAFNFRTGRPLDMSRALLRSVSPVHLEYLANLGVRASMSISLIDNGRLWGLIICHHTVPRRVAHEIRTACELLGQIVSVQLARRRDIDAWDERLRAQAIKVKLVEAMTNAPPFTDALVRGTPNLMDLVSSGGAGVCSEGTCTMLGKTPPEHAVRALINWLATANHENVFVTDSLIQAYPAIGPFKDVASGLLAVIISPERGQYLLWFRPEVIQTIKWGCDPRKPVVANGDRLSPRRSYQVWKESIGQRSVPWQPYEVDAAIALRRAILEIVVHQADELSRANAELRRSNEQLDSFAYVASHDLKEPVRGIRYFAHFLAEDYADKLDALGRSRLDTIVRLTGRMEDLIDSLLHYSRVGRTDLSIRLTDLNELIREQLDLLGPSLQRAGVTVRLRGPFPTIPCDPTRVGEVFTNLIANAAKYNDNPQKWVEIGYVPPTEPNRTGRFYVRDNGIGIRPEHYDAIFRMFRRLHARDQYGGGTGAGLAIAKKIVERHNGKIWLESEPGKGTTFFFTLGS